MATTHSHIPLEPPVTLDGSPSSRRASSRRPVVCQVLHSLNIGGAEVLAARLARKLSDRFEFIFACLDDCGPLGEQLQSEGFHLEFLARKPGLDLGCAWRLSQLCRRWNVDVVHAHQYTPFTYAMLSGIRPLRPPVLFTEHGRPFPDVPRQKRIIFNRLMLRRRDRVVGVGEAVRQALIRNEGMPVARVTVIYNGVDLESIAAVEAQRDQVRQEFDLAPSDFVLMQVARLDVLKDHATAIRTLHHLVKQCPEVRLVLVGEGPEQGMIERELRAHNLQPYVRLLGLRRDVPRLLAAADAFLLTSVTEGIPVTFIEAMARRLPIVSTAVGGVSEVVQDGVTGLLAPLGDDRSLAEAVMQLVHDARLGRQLGAAGRQRAEQMFAEEKMHDAYARQYEEMLGVRSP